MITHQSYTLPNFQLFPRKTEAPGRAALPLRVLRRLRRCAAPRRLRRRGRALRAAAEAAQPAAGAVPKRSCCEAHPVELKNNWSGIVITWELIEIIDL